VMVVALQVVSIGLFWLLISAFFEFFGFRWFCDWRVMGLPDEDGSSVFQAMKDQLFSRSWLFAALSSSAFVSVGLVSMSSSEATDPRQWLGLVSFLVGMGISMISSSHRFSKLFADAARRSN